MPAGLPQHRTRDSQIGTLIRADKDPSSRARAVRPGVCLGEIAASERHLVSPERVSKNSPLARFRQQATNASVYEFRVPAEGSEIASSRYVQTKPFIAIHPLDPEDASAITPMKAAMRAAKGVRSSTIDARAQFDALMERVPPPGDVTFETGIVGDVPGIWVHPS